MDEELKLVEGGVYKTLTGDLIQVRTLNIEKDEIHIYNITESANQWLTFSKYKNRIKLKIR